MRRIEAKTATLLAACCDIGALLGGLEPDVRAALREYGRLLGLAFQIADDVLDYTSSEDEIGKPIGHDLAEGFATLPLMIARENEHVAKELHAILVDGRVLSLDEARRAASIVRASDGPRLALERASKLASERAARLAKLPAEPAVRTLISPDGVRRLSEVLKVLTSPVLPMGLGG